jgi:hypothetical protein
MLGLQPEITSQLFWEFETMGETIQWFFNDIVGAQNNEIDRSKFMGGWEEGCKDASRWGLIIVGFVKYQIFKCKARR